MISASVIGKALASRNFHSYYGVPCSTLRSLINYAVNHEVYFRASNEGDAVAIASGSQLGGRKSVVLMQNSGLTNALSPIISLNHTFKIPILGFVSLHGETGLKNEPQHDLMGQITSSLLDRAEVAWSDLSIDTVQFERQLDDANAAMENGRPFFFIVRRGSFLEEPLTHQKEAIAITPELIRAEGDLERPLRNRVLYAMLERKTPKTVFVCTTGFTSREMFELGDSKHNFYMVGAIGCASSFGFGLAKAKPGHEIIVLDGDGAFLMRMGSLSTIGHNAPSNLLHIVLDNGCHDSTKGQATGSEAIDITSIAGACGYRRCVEVPSVTVLCEELTKWRAQNRLTFLHIKTTPGSREGLGRPTVSPPEVAQRLKVFLSEK